MLVQGNGIGVATDTLASAFSIDLHQYPVYLGVTLDRTLRYEAHIQKRRDKVSNSLL